MNHKITLPEDVPEDPDSLGFTLMHKTGLIVDVTIGCEEWQSVLTSELKQQWIEMLADTVQHEGYSRITIAVMLADDDTVAALNKIHLGKDEPTDVLSFPNDDDGFLGDIALAYGVIAGQSSEMGIAIGDHLLHLLIHGTLHLCGHDHIDADEADIMEAIEIDILAKHGMPNPYVIDGRPS